MFSFIKSSLMLRNLFLKSTPVPAGFTLDPVLLNAALMKPFKCEKNSGLSSLLSQDTLRVFTLQKRPL